MSSNVNCCQKFNWFNLEVLGNGREYRRKGGWKFVTHTYTHWILQQIRLWIELIIGNNWQWKVCFSSPIMIKKNTRILHSSNDIISWQMQKMHFKWRMKVVHYFKKKVLILYGLKCSRYDCFVSWMLIASTMAVR